MSVAHGPGERDPVLQRQQFRAWVLAHHPDVGGDPGQFAAGLARWEQIRKSGAAGAARPGPPARVSVVRTRHGLWLVLRWWQRRRAPARVR